MPAAAFACFALGVLGYGSALAWYTLVSFDLVNLVRDGYIDDAYYYFQIAKHMAAGHFSTFDGGITQTNGYHPLWMLMLVPFYWLFDAETALFAIKAFEIVLVSMGVLLVAFAVRLAGLPWILLFSVLPTIYATLGMLLGMEAAAGLLALGGFFVSVVLFMRDAARFRLALAGTAFLLPWVRLEYMAISLFATAALCYLSAWVRGQQHKRRTWMGPQAVPLLGAVLGTLAYFIYNSVVFGGAVPVSGVVKVAWSAAYDPSEDLPGTVARLVEAARWHALLAIELLIYLGTLLAVPAIRRRVFADRAVEARLVAAVLIFALALCLETVVVHLRHALFVSPDIAGYSYWYFVPGYLGLALAVPVRCYVAIALLRLFAPQGLARRLGVLGIVATGLVFVFDRSILADPFRFVRAKADSTAIQHSLPIMSYLGILAINPVLPRDAVLGSWSAGVIGYFSAVPVVNLDGLANSYTYFAATEAGEAAVTQMLDSFGITHIVDGYDAAVTTDRLMFSGHRVIDGEREIMLKMWRWRTPAERQGPPVPEARRAP